jgi:hypothetical protein
MHAAFLPLEPGFLHCGVGCLRSEHVKDFTCKRMWGNKDGATSAAFIFRDARLFALLILLLCAERGSRTGCDAAADNVFLYGLESETGRLPLLYCGVLWMTSVLLADFKLTSVLLADLKLTSVLLGDLKLTSVLLADLKLTSVLLADLKLTSVLLADLKLTSVLLADLKLTFVLLADLKLTSVLLADLKLTSVLLAELKLTSVLLVDLKFTSVLLADLKLTSVLLADLKFTSVLLADLKYILEKMLFLGRNLVHADTFQYISDFRLHFYGMTSCIRASGQGSLRFFK